MSPTESACLQIHFWFLGIPDGPYCVLMIPNNQLNYLRILFHSNLVLGFLTYSKRKTLFGSSVSSVPCKRSCSDEISLSSNMSEMMKASSTIWGGKRCVIVDPSPVFNLMPSDDALRTSVASLEFRIEFFKSETNWDLWRRRTDSSSGFKKN